MKTYEQLYDENGKYRLDESYTEILKLDKMLTDANIPHTLDRLSSSNTLALLSTRYRTQMESLHWQGKLQRCLKLMLRK